MDISSLNIEQDLFFDTVMSTISQGITVIDKELKIIYQNEMMKTKFGNHPGECCFAAYRGRSEPCEGCLIIEVLKDGQPRKGVSDICSPDGNVMWCEFVSGPIFDNNGELIGAIEVVRDVTEHIRISKECVTLRKEISRELKFDAIITQSKKMKQLFNLVERIAPTNSTVLIMGESGTGKGLLAKTIVEHSDRNENPLVSINCGSFPENLIESELFGHVKGAFTGALKDHNGLIAEAHGGTLFLDEIGDLPLNVQVKLLRFLQEKEVRPVGSTRTFHYDARIIAATNRNLEEQVQNGTFREDLYFRINVIPMTIPPLRERAEDIPLLAAHIFQTLCDKNSRTIEGLSSEVLRIFMDYDWPGNVRELENAIEYSIHLANDKQLISIEHLPPRFIQNKKPEEVIKNFFSINDYIKFSILSLQVDHTDQQIADLLGISRKNLWEKRKKFGIEHEKSNS
jgi:transcriptional regulator with PAS, ATPase and Fis domain